MRRRMVGSLIAGALLMVAVPVASANGQTVYQAIAAQNKVVFNSAGYKLLLHPNSFKTRSNLKPYVPKMEKLQQLLAHEATVVSRSSISSSAQKTGRDEWVTGTGFMSIGIGALVAELKDVLHNNLTAARTQLTKEKKFINSGLALRKKGDKLLGLPSED
jgi:hypothetical protein